MAIKKSFGGQSISKPGAYSRSKTDPDAGTDLASNDTIFVLGEADAGPGGSEEGIQSFSASAFNQLKAKYKSGPIVDAAKIALVPSRTPGIGGAGRILVWKTNSSTQASLALANTFATIKALEYGVGGNRITYKTTISAASDPATSSTADITDFAGLNTETLEIRVNGGAKETVTFASPTNITDVVAQASFTGITASNTGDQLTLTLDATANESRDGFAKSFEIISTSTALAKLFMSAGQVSAASEAQATIEITQPRDSASELSTIGGNVTISIGRDASDSCTAATATTTSTSLDLTATGSSEAAISLSYEDYPLVGQLVDAINDKAGWTATVKATNKNKPSTALDECTTGAFSEDGSTPARIKVDAEETKDMFSASSLVEASSGASETGLPDAEGRTNLSGGTRGSTASSSFDEGLAASLSTDYNVAVPCISQDASEDILAGTTDPSSAYDIETVHAMLDTHLRLRGSVKNRKEAQGVVGYRKASKEDVYSQTATIGSELIQLACQDVLVVDSSNELKWKQPHIFAAAMAGARLGSSVGEPLTHKYLSFSGFGHYVNTSTGITGGDFDPEIDFDEAIDAGVTFTEPFAGGARVVVDNTTYGTDANFVFNRGSVVEASQFIAKEIRRDAEAAFVGQKTTAASAGAIKSRIRTRLIQLFESQITTASDDAPSGYVEESFIVSVQGNTANVQVEVKPVQGLDFIFIDFTLGDTTQSA